ncbi:DUF3987 domain-containing protein [Rhizobium sp. S152]|uniref:DUF3987 domain-containing protein n=1 Tax=Rhizobium sp. S152 TaxID=3055038 RepID=UPI0025A9B02F|nr:DUF3987 domain-containing protein [Rhizobium sp. S152]MDM9629781.1 DUF3987 domain-containing protein [Rhizobium sp. S152]
MVQPKAPDLESEKTLSCSMTLVTSKHPLTKTISRLSDGTLKKSGGVALAEGAARRVDLVGAPNEILRQLSGLLVNLTAHQAIICAPPPASKPEWQIVSRDAAPYNQGAITRSKENFVRRAEPAILAMDFDTAEFPDQLLDRLRDAGSVSHALASVHAGFQRAAVISRNSVSAAVAQPGKHVSGHHRYYVVADGSALESFARNLADRLMLSGFLWGKISETGAILPRTIFDVPATEQASKIFYEADPILQDGLTATPGARDVHRTAGGVLDTSDLLPLTEAERKTLSGHIRALEKQLEPEARKQRDAWQKRRIANLVAKGMSEAKAVRTVTCALERKELGEDWEIALDDGTFVTVGEILAAPDAYHRKTCSDPMEPDYGAGRNLAVIYSDRHPVRIYSHAHGGIDYILTPSPETYFDVLPDLAEAPQKADGLEPFDIFGHDDVAELREPPPNCLPPILERWARSEARRKGVSLAFAAASGLTAVCGAIGGSLRIQVREHDEHFTEPAALWTVLVANPGSAKSATINAALEPIRTLERKWRREDEPKHAEWSKRAKLAAKAKTDMRADPEPRLRRLLVDDVTAEKQIMLHAANPNGLLRSTDELTGILESLGAYKRSGGGDRSFMLRLFDGGEIKVDRVTSGSLFAERGLMSILAGTQPDKLRTMVRDLQTDGLLQRFLFILDDGEKVEAVDEPADRSALVDYEAMLREFASANYLFPASLKMSAAARPVFKAFMTEVSNLAELPAGVSWRGHVHKMEKIAARVVLAFHAMDQFAVMGSVSETLAIDDTTVTRALTFTRFLLRHSLRFYEQFFDADPAHTETLGLAGFLLTRPELTEIKRRDIYQARAALKGAENRRALVAVARSLEDAGWLAVTEREADGPSSWRVNPRIHVRFKDRAARERAERSARHDAILRAADARRRL